METHRTFFVTGNAWERRALFGHPANAELFLQLLDEQRKLGRCFVHAFVLMPDHFHLLVTPTAKISLEKLVQYIKGGFSFRYHRQRPAKLAVWQDGYTQHRVRDERDYFRHLEYIRQNPVRAGLVVDAADHAWSSANPRWAALIDPAPRGLKPQSTCDARSPA
jgi:putative transposase